MVQSLSATSPKQGWTGYKDHCLHQWEVPGTSLAAVAGRLCEFWPCFLSVVEQRMNVVDAGNYPSKTALVRLTEKE